MADGNAVRDTRDSRDGDRARTTPVVFLRQVVAEMRKVVWPTRKTTLQMTAFVFAFTVAMALFLWLSDKALEYVFYDLILGWRGR